MTRYECADEFASPTLHFTRVAMPPASSLSSAINPAARLQSATNATSGHPPPLTEINGAEHRRPRRQTFSFAFFSKSKTPLVRCYAMSTAIAMPKLLCRSTLPASPGLGMKIFSPVIVVFTLSLFWQFIIVVNCVIMDLIGRLLAL